jgi:hypothetical protein
VSPEATKNCKESKARKCLITGVGIHLRSDMDKLTKVKREAYYMGLRTMWGAFRYTADIEDADLKTALGKYGLWLDDTLLPWVRGDVDGIIGHHKWSELPLPPGIDRLPDIKSP